MKTSKGRIWSKSEQLGAQVQQILSGLPQVRSVFAERVSQGFYINERSIVLRRAKYGLTIADVQQAVESGIGGMNRCRKRRRPQSHPINVRTSVIFATTSES